MRPPARASDPVLHARTRHETTRRVRARSRADKTTKTSRDRVTFRTRCVSRARSVAFASERERALGVVASEGGGRATGARAWSAVCARWFDEARAIESPVSRADGTRGRASTWIRGDAVTRDGGS